MPGYLPPESINLPFEFTDQGYAPPGSSSILFNFAERGSLGTLRAAVNVMTPYWYTTYTYTKSCPKYVVGYGSGGVQIIKGRCLFGGVRDLQGVINSIPHAGTSGNVSAYINPISKREYSYLTASIGSGFTEIMGDLQAFIKGLQDLNLTAQIDIHSPVDLRARVKPRVHGDHLFPSYIHGWQPSNLGMTLGGTHFPVDLKGQMRVTQRVSSLISSSIHAWHIKYLNAFLRIVQPYDFPASIYPILPSDLSGYLKARPRINLPSYIRGWQSYSLGAEINQIWAKDLIASIYGITDTNRNLSATLKGYGSEYKNLNVIIGAMHYSLLDAYVRATYFSNISAYLYPVLPMDLYSTIHVWHVRLLQGIITVAEYPWNLTAQIYPRGIWSTFTANISPVQAAKVYGNLTMSVHPWERRDFPAYIFGANAIFLSAFLNPLGAARDLHASIYPKMIHLTTIVNIATMSNYNLSAIINYPCFKTGYSNLNSSVYAKYRSDLYAYIKALFYNYKPSSLSAKIGTAASYLEVDKIRLSINIFPTEFFVEDKFRFVLKLSDAGSFLYAYVRGTLRYNSISANITCDAIPKYVFSSTLKNRELVVHKTYDGIFKMSETIEMAFKSAVSDYFYSSAGEYVWKNNRFDRWMFDVKSILPPNSYLRLSRRLHKATTVYDLKKFQTVDEAIKFAIAYVTEYPQSVLSATIINRGTYNILNSIINPRYIVRSRVGLTSNIVPVTETIVVNSGADIIKI